MKKVDLIPHSRDWRGQFVIGPSLSDLPDGFLSIALDGMEVGLHQTTKHVFLCDTDGYRLGVLIGTAIDPEAQEILSGAATVPVSKPNGSGFDAEAFEDWLYRLCGSFLCIIATGSARRIYIDAAGTHPLVFAPDKRRAASATGLMLTDQEYKDRFNVADYQTLDIDHCGWLTAGLSAHRGVERLIPNHYLDLNDWTMHRHWPRQEFELSSDTVRQTQQLIDSVFKTVAALTKAGRVVSALTGGQDTRAVLAASRPVLAAMSFYTIGMAPSTRDVAIASNVAKRFGIRHTVYPVIEATPEEVCHWRYMSSHCIGGYNACAHPSDRALNEFDFVLGGPGGEVGGVKWTPSVGPLRSVS